MSLLLLLLLLPPAPFVEPLRGLHQEEYKDLACGCACIAYIERWTVQATKLSYSKVIVDKGGKLWVR